jgi:acetyltransferase-like isoleucine patch superfamily enzyme
MAVRHYSAQETAALYESLRIRLWSQQPRLTVGAIIEGPCLIESEGPELLGCGAYTDIRRNVRISRCTFGRYCSIGPQANFGSPEHRLDGLSMASAFSSDLDWTKRDRNFPLVRGTVSYSKTKIGNDVWVGNGAFIRAGITIGDGAAIGARAVVTKDVPPYAIVLGVPGRIVRYRFPEELIARLLAVKWWDYDPDFLSTPGLDFRDVEGMVSFLERSGNSLRPFQPQKLVVAPAA